VKQTTFKFGLRLRGDDANIQLQSVKDKLGVIPGVHRRQDRECRGLAPTYRSVGCMYFTGFCAFFIMVSFMCLS
jgi:hypothetical protein